ncbi:protein STRICTOSIDINE SYNTHASE-LIKE 4-like [Phragmites australis]|uniref:protein STRICTOSIDINE SYNTHASE-LIKE 4-like n=1 Tax=Phragmites australis TaxID=29695 RepID=UPI002D76F3AB|nr:protein STRICTOSIDINE SYNTHASE-LIKE 4-like [Phragmites australis]
MAPGLFAAAAAAAAAAVLAAVASLAAHVALNCHIQPNPSPPPPPTPRYPPNNLLQRLEKLGEGALRAPEDVYVDAAAGWAAYTATRDGWLQRMHPNNGSWERWRFVGGTGLLGIAPSADSTGTMLVCDADRGLLRVGEEGVTLLASEVDGSTIRFADAAVEASDGMVYFSDASARFGFDRWMLDFIESRPTGRLLRYDPRTGETSVVLDSLGFANGVALPRDEAFVVVCESTRFRCMKVWLKGEKAGMAETFIDNLPGAPDNIRLGSDGSFWIALIQLRSPRLDLINRWSLTKRIVASFPALIEWSKATAKGAMVAQVSEDGKIIRLLDDSEGKVINFITSVTEFNGDLFLGSLSTNFIGKLSLAQVTQVTDSVS